MKKVIVFDMDDTLYDENVFVKSGFKAVSKFLENNYQLNCDYTYQWMWNRLSENGRGAIFDDLLKLNGLYGKTLVKKCLSIYRLHKPSIQLPQDSKNILEELQSYPLYLVTDGNKIVQSNKVKALGLEQFMKKCYITHRYGVCHSKPSPFCFQLIAQKEKVEPYNIVYIGDNPSKDFVGIKPLGFRTIRIMQGQHKQKNLSKDYEADRQIRSILELPQTLRKIWPEMEI